MHVSIYFAAPVESISPAPPGSPRLSVLPSRAVSRRNRTHETPRTWSRYVWLAALVVGLGLGTVEIRHRTVAFGSRAARDAPTWIWRDHDLRHIQAAGFYAVKEFDLVAAPPEAEVRILGDAEYLLFLNGVRIGSNRYSSGAPLDRYRLERWLHPGRNRLVIELRSPSGAGGLWCELAAGGQQLVRSDGSWTVYETNWRGLFGERPLLSGARPRRLGRSPLGRWGSPAVGPERPTFEVALAAREPQPAESFRVSGSNDPWQPCGGRGRRPPSLGPLVEFDFGAERTGYLQLSYREEPGRRAGAPPSAVLLAFGDEPIGALPWSAQTLFQPIPGAGLYQDSTVRRFRYVAVAALPGVFSAEVLTTTAASWPALAPRDQPEAGILGVRPPPSSAPVEHEVWRELERATGSTVGKSR
ncbi:MAG: hypothetical protein ABI689_11200 [Thermoanaerobaculia bacterium]